MGTPSQGKRALQSFPLVPAPRPDVVEATIQQLETRLERFPSYPDLWNQLGLVRAAAGSLAEATACFERALAVNPGFLAALENRAWAAITAGDGGAWERFHGSAEEVRLHPGVRHHLQVFATARFESVERAHVMASMPPQGRYEAAHFLDRVWLMVAMGRSSEKARSGL